MLKRPTLLHLIKTTRVTRRTPTEAFHKYLVVLEIAFRPRSFVHVSSFLLEKEACILNFFTPISVFSAALVAGSSYWFYNQGWVEITHPTETENASLQMNIAEGFFRKDRKQNPPLA